MVAGSSKNDFYDVSRGFEMLEERLNLLRDDFLSSIESDEVLRDEREFIEQHTQIIEKNVSNIRLGVEDAKVFANIVSNFHALKAEKRKYKEKGERLSHELCLLREELDLERQLRQKAQQQIEQAFEELAQSEEENRHLRFMNSLAASDVQRESFEKEDNSLSWMINDDLNDLPLVRDEQQHNETIDLTVCKHDHTIDLTKANTNNETIDLTGEDKENETIELFDESSSVLNTLALDDLGFRPVCIIVNNAHSAANAIDETAKQLGAEMRESEVSGVNEFEEQNKFYLERLCGHETEEQHEQDALVPTTSSFVPSHFAIICVGGAAGQSLNSIEIFDSCDGYSNVYDDPRCVWRRSSNKQTTTGHRQMSVACVGAKLFIVGGRIGKTGVSISTVKCLDLVSEKWAEELSPLRIARRRHALVSVNEKHLFAIGGRGNTKTRFKSVDRYDISENVWAKVAPMGVCSGEVAAAVHSATARIYVVGGTDDDGLASHRCEYYDTTTNTWTEIATMHDKRYLCGAAIVGECLYAIGGKNVNGVPIKNCERYSFAEKRWTKIKSLSIERESLGVSTDGSCIFAIGGKSKLLNLNSVEVYDPVADEWTLSASLVGPRYEHGVVALSLPMHVIRNF